MSAVRIVACIPESCACAPTFPGCIPPGVPAAQAAYAVPTGELWGLVLIAALIAITAIGQMQRARLDRAQRNADATNQPRPGITDLRICPTTGNACERACAGARCRHEE